MNNTNESMPDELDRKILELLKKNSRASFAEISKKIFLSASSVRERIKRMEDLGLIRAYSVVLDQSLMGNTLEVVIMLKIFSGKFQSAISEINSCPEVMEAFRITGQHNIHIKVALRDQLHLQSFIDKLLVFGEPTTYLILSNLKKDL
ncbi:Lrp/AsnC family transcriptional regulator [Salinimicrobium sp. GXAS 041]|uniref:Lrp/AsnC family transcriptional regulator n=1 Tax=Salinimicrobium sp. GXAS 041 TaxID=3400806 RepID=UPI003C77F059